MTQKGWDVGYVLWEQHRREGWTGLPQPKYDKNIVNPQKNQKIPKLATGQFILVIAVAEKSYRAGSQAAPGIFISWPCFGSNLHHFSLLGC